MIDVVVLGKVLLYNLHDPGALADLLVLYLDMRAQGIETGGDGPHVDVVEGLDPLHGLDLPDQLCEVDVLGHCLEQHCSCLLDYAIRPFEDDQTDHEAEDGVNDKPFGEENDDPADDYAGG